MSLLASLVTPCIPGAFLCNVSTNSLVDSRLNLSFSSSTGMVTVNTLACIASLTARCVRSGLLRLPAVVDVARRSLSLRAPSAAAPAQLWGLFAMGFPFSMRSSDCFISRRVLETSPCSLEGSSSSICCCVWNAFLASSNRRNASGPLTFPTRFKYDSILVCKESLVFL